MADRYLLKLLDAEHGPMWFGSWGSGLTDRLSGARQFSTQDEASDVGDNFFDSRGVPVYPVRESRAFDL